MIDACAPNEIQWYEWSPFDWGIMLEIYGIRNIRSPVVQQNCARNKLSTVAMLHNRISKRNTRTKRLANVYIHCRRGSNFTFVKWEVALTGMSKSW